MGTPRKVIGWDTETHKITGDNPTPRLVCLTLGGNGDTLDAARYTFEGVDNTVFRVEPRSKEWRVLVTREDAVGAFLWMRDVADVYVAHNAPYDLSILRNEEPRLTPIIFEDLETTRSRDTAVREKLLAIAHDRFQSTRYSLAALVLQYFGVSMVGKTGPDVWRLRYAELDGIDPAAWPESAVEYALMDAVWARRVFLQQARDHKLESYPVVSGGDVINEGEQTAADWCLRLMALHGPMTDPDAVATFEAGVRAQVEESHEAARRAGIVKVNKCKVCQGTGFVGDPPTLVPCQTCGGDPAYLPPRSRVPLKKPVMHQGRKRAWVRATYGPNPPMTAPSKKFPRGQVKTDNDTLLGTGVPDLVAYAELSSAEKLLNTYVPILHMGAKHPIVSRPNVLVRSGRTSWRNPNFQNPPRAKGFRQCFVPPEGTVFVAIDYSAFELRTLAQTCLLWFGYSRLAEAFRAGRDPHLEFAAELMNIPYEEAVERKKAKDPKVLDMRQMSKAADFGFPGGLGAKTFVAWAHASYGVDLTITESQRLKDHFLTKWSEVQDFLDEIGEMSGPYVEDPEDAVRFVACQPHSGRVRGGCNYTSGANTYFHGPAADAAKAAMWDLTRAMYLDEDSPLYGVRVWAFIHDEFVFTGPPDTDRWVPEAERLMISGAQRVITDVPVAVESTVLGKRWGKG